MATKNEQEMQLVNECASWLVMAKNPAHCLASIVKDHVWRATAHIEMKYRNSYCITGKHLDAVMQRVKDNAIKRKPSLATYLG